MKLFDKIAIAVNTEFKPVNVEFTIIAVLNKPNEIYALLAQDRVVKGQYMANNTWKLSKPFDLHKLDILMFDKSHLDITGENELNKLENQTNE